MNGTLQQLVPPRQHHFRGPLTAPQKLLEDDWPLTEYSRYLKDAVGIIFKAHDILSDSNSTGTNQETQIDFLKRPSEISEPKTCCNEPRRLCPTKRKGKIQKPKKKKANTIITELALFEKHFYLTRNHSTIPKVDKLRKLYYEGKYLLHPRKKTMIIANRMNLKYFNPIYPILCPQKQFRLYDYVFPVNSNLIMANSTGADMTALYGDLKSIKRITSIVHNIDKRQYSLKIEERNPVSYNRCTGRVLNVEVTNWLESSKSALGQKFKAALLEYINAMSDLHFLMQMNRVQAMPDGSKVWLKKIDNSTKKFIKGSAYISRVERISNDKCLGYLDKFIISEKMCEITGYLPELGDGESGFGILNHLVSKNYMGCWSE
jgi:hypothetical protein